MVSRRTLLVGGCMLLPGVAGCLDSEDSDEQDDEDTDTENGDEDESGLTATDPDARFVSTFDLDDATDQTADTEEITLATRGDVNELGSIEYREDEETYSLGVALTEDATDAFVDELEAIDGFDRPDQQELTVHGDDDELIDSSVLGAELADAMETGEWDGTFLITADDESTLEGVKDIFE